MMTGATQTLWAELIASTLADAGVRVCVVSPGSRSTPLGAARANDGRRALPTIIDERAAAFYALGAARATLDGAPVALVCTSGTAAAHYLPALVEASYAGVPLVAITADRPPELQHCGASQTIDQVNMYGAFVRGAFDLGAPEGSPRALRAVRRKLIQAIALANGPSPGPVHVNVPLRKPLEPSAPSTDAARALAKLVGELRKEPVVARAPHLAAAAASLRARGAIERALASHPRSEGAVLRAVVQAAGSATLQLGNSLPIRVVDQVATSHEPRTVLTQRGAAGIDGLIASAAGATRAGKPVVLVLGDVRFAPDLGGLLAAREATAPLAIVAVDNAGGRIFAGLPVARAIATAAYDKHWTTAPGLDPAAVAPALGARGIPAASPAAVAAALTAALAPPGTTLLPAPVTPTGAQDVRRTALELLT